MGYIFSDDIVERRSSLEREPISKFSKWDPRRGTKGDRTAPTDTVPAGRCLVRWKKGPNR